MRSLLIGIAGLIALCTAGATGSGATVPLAGTGWSGTAHETVSIQGYGASTANIPLGILFGDGTWTGSDNAGHLLSGTFTESAGIITATYDGPGVRQLEDAIEAWIEKRTGIAVSVSVPSPVVMTAKAKTKLGVTTGLAVKLNTPFTVTDGVRTAHGTLKGGGRLRQAF